MSFTPNAKWCMPSPFFSKNLAMGLSGAVGESNSILLSPTIYLLLQEKIIISLLPIILCKSNQLALKKLLIGSAEAVNFAFNVK